MALVKLRCRYGRIRICRGEAFHARLQLRGDLDPGFLRGGQQVLQGRRPLDRVTVIIQQRIEGSLCLRLGDKAGSALFDLLDFLLKLVLARLAPL